METKAPLCKKLFELLSDELQAESYDFVICPSHPSINEPFYKVVEDKKIEVTCFKSTFIEIFKEAHDLWLNVDPNNVCYNDIDVYYATFGMFLTTPENSTCMRIHQHILEEQTKLRALIPNFLVRELFAVQRLLCSSHNRLNKSSSLWILFRKLHILAKTHTPDMDFSPFLNVFAKSGSKHFSNYHSWDTAKYFHDILEAEQALFIYDQTKKFCWYNLKDSAAWNALGYMTIQYLDGKRETYNIARFRISSTKNFTEYDKIVLKIDSRHKDLVEQLLQLIDTLTITESPPFNCLFRLTQNKFGLWSHTFHRWRVQIADFESKYGILEYIRNHPIVPEKYSKDFLLTSLFLHYGLKKLLLMRL